MSSFDNDAVEATQLRIGSRQDFLRFMQLLRADLRDNRHSWENDTLETYLEALQAVVTDWEGRFLNRGESIPEELSWRLLGEILAAATLYE